MSLPSNDPTPLQIRCPSCGQRFKVGADLRDRTVECGSCEHRFRITDEVVQRVRKVYPGERQDAGLSRFQRVPLAAVVPANLQTVSYAEEPDPSLLEPPPPQRVFAGLIGVGLLVIFALLLVFGASRGGILDGMPTLNRQMLAAFVSVVAGILLVYANRRARLRAGIGAVVAGALMVSLPLFFKEGSGTAKVAGKPVTPKPDGPEQTLSSTLRDENEVRRAELRLLIGTAPLEKEQERMAQAKSTKKVWGLWLRGLRESNKLLVRDYLLRATGAGSSSHLYPRDGGDYLAVVTEVDFEIGELALLIKPFGTVAAVHDELGVVEVKVDNSVFEESPFEKLTNKKDPAFYELNKRELESIDLARVGGAVARLMDSEPKLYRADIAARLLGLLREPGVDFKGNVCRALKVWAEDLKPTADPVVAEVERLVAAGRPIPKEFFDLLAQLGDTRVLPVLDELWAADSTEWEPEYAKFGPAAEVLVLRRFPTTEGVLRREAVQFLGRVGGKDSLPFLEAAKETASSTDLRAVIDRSIGLIQGRINP